MYSLVPVETLSPTAMTVLRRIYEEGFPPRERADFAAVTNARQDAELSLALIGDGQPAGFAMLRPLGGTGWIYLRYLVVDSAQRGQGLGGLLWEQLTARLRDAGYTLLVFDVEDPDEPDRDAAEIEIRHRRIRFYQRQGASLLPVRGYRTPDVAAASTGQHRAGWAPMRLMTAPLSGAAPDAEPVVEAVYRFRWELEPGDFPETERT